jgi:hypothetical protein
MNGESVAIAITLGRREQSPADGCWRERRAWTFTPRSAVTKLHQR